MDMTYHHLCAFSMICTVKNINLHFLQVFSLHSIASKSFPDFQTGKPGGAGDVANSCKGPAHGTREPVAVSYGRHFHYGMTALEMCLLAGVVVGSDLYIQTNKLRSTTSSKHLLKHFPFDRGIKGP
jgi:hypothetical protein